MATEITANPVELRKCADEIGKCHTLYRNNLQTSKSQVDSLKGIWTGDAATAFNASFQQLLDKCSEGLINNIFCCVDALGCLALLYVIEFGVRSVRIRKRSRV